MGLSRLSKKCRECNKVDRCSNKRMEAIAYIGERESISNEAPVSVTINLVHQPSNQEDIVKAVMESINTKLNRAGIR